MKTENKRHELSVDGEIFKIGDKVPFLNNRGNTDHAIIEEFVLTNAKNPYWFKGKNIRTGKSVFYSLHLSLKM